MPRPRRFTWSLAGGSVHRPLERPVRVEALVDGARELAQTRARDRLVVADGGAHAHERAVAAPVEEAARELVERELEAPDHAPVSVRAVPELHEATVAVALDAPLVDAHGAAAAEVDDARLLDAPACARVAEARRVLGPPAARGAVVADVERDRRAVGAVVCAREVVVGAQDAFDLLVER